MQGGMISSFQFLIVGKLGFFCSGWLSHVHIVETLSAGLVKNSVNGTTAVTSPISLSEEVGCTCVNFQAEFELFLSTMDILFLKCRHFLLMVI